MQRSTLGVGPALRKVREARGLTIDEAARDTRIRREFLEAIERDEFDRLLGDVHARGCLRTYATYLRLSPDKVVAAYAAGRPEDTAFAPLAPPVHPELLLGRRRRDSHRLVGLVAATVLVLAGAFGILSARQPAPAPAELPSEAAVAPPAPRAITVALLARRAVEVTIVVDGGQARTFALAPGEGRSFQADLSMRVRLAEGGTARVTMNGIDLGYPGKPGAPWEDTFGSPPASPSG